MAEESREVRETRPVWEAEVPWVVSYLREDIQDLRSEVRETRRLTVESYEKLDAKIEGLRREMSVQFRWLVTTMVAVGALVVAILELLR